MLWRLGVGAALGSIGLVWLLQGIGVLGGSSMTGDTKWAVIGAVSIAAGGGLVASWLRERNRQQP